MTIESLRRYLGPAPQNQADSRAVRPAGGLRGQQRLGALSSEVPLQPVVVAPLVPGQRALGHVARKGGEHRDRVGGEALQVRPVDLPGRLVPVHVVLRDPGVRIDRGENQKEPRPAQQRRAGQPRGAQREAGCQHTEYEQPQPALEDVDEQAKPGEPVGLLVHVHPVESRGDHHQRQHAQQTERPT
jgi:hypothetical protein